MGGEAGGVAVLCWRDRKGENGGGGMVEKWGDEGGAGVNDGSTEDTL